MISDQEWREAITAAAARMTPHLESTPLRRAHFASELLGCDIRFKAECLQESGSFKFRPALNGILAHLDAARRQGVVTSSSGNYAVAVSWVSRRFGVKATIVTTPAVSQEKLERARRLGGEVVFCEPTYDARQKLVDEIKSRTGALELHSHSSLETIAGDATCGSEILGTLPGVGTILVPTSGGGFLGGVALAVKLSGSKAKVIGVQSTGNDAFVRSFHARKPEYTTKVDTICDGLVAARPGPLGFDVALRHVDDMVAVPDDVTLEAARMIAREEHYVVEPSGAIGVGAIMSGRLSGLAEPIVVILSGGNVDLSRIVAK